MKKIIVYICAIGAIYSILVEQSPNSWLLYVVIQVCRFVFSLSILLWTFRKIDAYFHQKGEQ